MKILLVSLAFISAITLAFQNCSKNTFSSEHLASEKKDDIDTLGICAGSAPKSFDYRTCTDGSLKAVQKFNVTCDNGSWVVENDGPIDYKECPNSCVGAAPTYSNEATNCPAPNASLQLALKKFKANCDSSYKWVKIEDGIDSSQCPVTCNGSLSADESCSSINSELSGTITNYYTVSCGTNGIWSRSPAASGANYQCACSDTTKTYNSTSKSCLPKSQVGSLSISGPSTLAVNTCGTFPNTANKISGSISYNWISGGIPENCASGIKWSTTGTKVFSVYAVDEAGATVTSATKTVEVTNQMSPVYSLKLTSKGTAIDSNHAYLVGDQKLFGTSFGKDNSINLVIQNNGNTVCTISPSTISSNYSGSNAIEFSALFSIAPSSLGKTIAVGASETIAINSQIILKKNFAEINTSKSGLLSVAEFKCNEDSSKATRLSVAFNSVISVDSIAQKGRGCIARLTYTDLNETDSVTPKYSYTTMLKVADGTAIQHATSTQPSRNFVALSKSGFYSNLLFDTATGVSTWPSSVFFEGSSEDYEVVRTSVDNLIFIKHKTCGNVYSLLPSRQSNYFANINFLNGHVNISFLRSQTTGLTEWQFFGGVPNGSWILPNSVTQIPVSPWTSSTGVDDIHSLQFGWK